MRKSILFFLLALCLAACNAPPLYGKNAEEFLKQKGEPAELIEALKRRRPIEESDAQRLAAYGNVAVKHLVGANPGTPVSLLVALSRHEDSEVRTGVAVNENTPLDALLSMRTRGVYTTVNSMLARNPKIPVEILWEMQRFQEASLLDLGLNPASPPDLLRTVAKKGTSLDRTWLATNPSIPEDVMLDLAQDPDELVRQYLARNRNLSDEARSLISP
ncbi:MAG: hypothetical protein HKO64_10470 [Xanthomonadales bacterium]|nr:hypothetical protein [Xanthomonadales bacterium]NNL96032.1 hypothetical protein [Xanthomonadales bacterium]